MNFNLIVATIISATSIIYPLDSICRSYKCCMKQSAYVCIQQNKETSVAPINNDTCSFENAVRANTYKNYMEAYFAGLTKNYAYNHRGSCGYVAISMLLTYYDTYLNDNIVPEEYDYRSLGTGIDMVARNSSPGSFGFDFSKFGVNGMTGAEYYELVKEYQDTSLHARLIYLGQELYGMYDFNDTNNENCITYANDRSELLRSYLQSESGLTPVIQYSVHSVSTGSSESIRKEVISEVKRGNPVVVSVKQSGATTEHVCVAYAYDENLDELYFHSGWHSMSTRCTLSNMGYDTFTGLMVVRFNLSHVCSDNYEVRRNGSWEYYCPCSSEIIVC